LSLCFATTTFRGMALPSSSGEPTLLSPVDRANLRRTDGVYIGQNFNNNSVKFFIYLHADLTAQRPITK
jgi:hypothetical protein